MFCPHCGNPVDQLPGLVAVEEREPVEVQLARIVKEQAVEVARIEANARRAEASSAETIAETEADGQVDTAEAVAELVMAATTEAEPEPETAPEPLILDAPTINTELDDAPPETEGSPAPDLGRKRTGFGMW